MVVLQLSLAAIAAWPSDIPPSFDGTSLLNNTEKPAFFKSIMQRIIKYRLQNTPPLNATVFNFVLSLAELAISSKPAARQL
jgi:hypothetical protein